MHPFQLFLSLSPYKRKTLLTYYITSIYVSFICVSFVTLTNTAFSAFIPLSLLCLFVLWLCVASYSLSERFFVSFSFLLNRPTPHFHDTESVATPFLNFFIFQFSKIFLLKKCGMIYLHFVCVYVGTEYLHLVVVCVELDWCLELVVCVELDVCVEF